MTSASAPTFPADLQYVTSIGGTHLVHKAGSRGWAESVWGTNPTGRHGIRLLERRGQAILAAC